ncbi:MAG: tRNA 2-thiocytidine(32) synthetase TtcA [Rhodanobacteraceae bacterium]
MSTAHPQFAPDHRHAHEASRLAKRLRHAAGRAIADYNLIEDGDRVMVCLSGGKDSWTLLDLLLSLQARAPVRFELVAVNLDQKQPGFPEHVIPDYLAERGVPFHVIEQDTYSVVTRVVPNGKTLCSLCSRLRRGALYAFAEREGFNKIALGHHRDDILATFFLNLFYGGRLKAMPPKLLSDDRKHVVIRPLSHCCEHEIADYAAERGFPIIPCSLCGSQETLQRKQVRRMLDTWEREHPGRSEIMFRALAHVAPSQLADASLFDFAALGSSPDAGRADAHAWLHGRHQAIEAREPNVEEVSRGS